MKDFIVYIVVLILVIAAGAKCQSAPDSCDIIISHGILAHCNYLEIAETDGTGACVPFEGINALLTINRPGGDYTIRLACGKLYCLRIKRMTEHAYVFSASFIMTPFRRSARLENLRRES